MDCAAISSRGLRNCCRAAPEVLGAIVMGNRLFVEAVIWKFRTGVPWRDMPVRFGAWKNVHTRFSRWAKKGIWESLFKAAADDPDTEYAMIDATIVRAHQHSAGAPKKTAGRKRSGGRAAD